jgi:hypothetical protein
VSAGHRAPILVGIQRTQRLCLLPVARSPPSVCVCVCVCVFARARARANERVHHPHPQHVHPPPPPQTHTHTSVSVAINLAISESSSSASLPPPCAPASTSELPWHAFCCMSGCTEIFCFWTGASPAALALKALRFSISDKSSAIRFFFCQKKKQILQIQWRNVSDASSFSNVSRQSLVLSDVRDPPSLSNVIQ